MGRFSLNREKMEFCVYCGNENHKSKMTREHVIPKAIGGNITPNNPFILNNVCERCNTLCGIYVDGPFIRNWLINSKIEENATKHLDLTKDPILPLKYIGQLEEDIINGNVCDYWLGPTGDSIFHFHKPYPSYKESRVSVGPPINVKKQDIDPGFVFVFIVATNPVWHRVILLSIINQFEDSDIYLGNAEEYDSNKFKKIPENLLPLRDKLKKIMSDAIKTKFTFYIDFEQRFMGKLALGLGSIFLNPDFQTSPNADLLRNFLWEKDFEKRAKIEIGGIPLLKKGDPRFLERIKWPPGHTIIFFDMGRFLALYAIFYGELSCAIEITSNRSHWNSYIEEGASVFVIAPGLQRYVGPLSFIRYLNTLHGLDYISKEFNELIKDIEKIPELPPFHIDG
jgi:hypothetical protein